jgi:hypothetical protein
VVQRREKRYRLEPVGQSADREERAREQEERKHDNAHDNDERAVAFSLDRPGRQGRGDGERAEHRCRDRQHAPEARNGAEQRGDGKEGGR